LILLPLFRENTASGSFLLKKLEIRYADLNRGRRLNIFILLVGNGLGDNIRTNHITNNIVINQTH
jgi:hypothetical protein